MAMSVTITEHLLGSVKAIGFAWVSAADGTAVGTTSYYYSGKILQFATVPGAGAVAPTAAYDITITDNNGLDVLAGQGADRHTSNTESVQDDTLLGVVAGSVLTINVSNAGDSNEGAAYLFIR